MDHLDEVLWDLRLSVQQLSRLTDAGEAALVPANRRVPRPVGFHMVCVVDGRWQCANTGERALGPGDVLIFRSEASTHWGNAVHPFAWSHTGKTLRKPGSPLSSGMTGRCLCLSGTLTLDGDAEHPVVRDLPDSILIPCSEICASWPIGHPAFLVHQLLLSDVVGAHDPIIERLLEALTVNVIKTFFRAGQADGPCSSALTDKHIGPAIAAMHRSPEYNWTLDRLAETAGLSRTAFYLRFSQRMGMPPMRYLTQRRMHIALARLRRGQWDLDELAHIVGYRSATAFHKAFKRVHGLTPSEAVLS